MLNAKNLNYWTIQKFPYFITPISNYTLFSFEMGQVASISTNFQTFCYVNSGSVKVVFESYEDQRKNEQTTISTGGLIQWSGNGFVEFNSLAENTKVLLLSFRILRPDQQDLFGSIDSVNYDIPVSMQTLSIDMPHNLLLEIGSEERRLMELMCEEEAARSAGYFNKMQFILSQFLLEIVRNYPHLPRYIDAVAITSNTDNDRPLAKGRAVWISDTEIWCGEPETKGSFLLRTMRAERYFVSNNETGEKINCSLETSPELNNAKVGKIEATEKSMHYKVLFWADHGIKPLDIELYSKKWIYLRTKIMSNMLGTVGLCVYSTNGHNWFGSNVTIQQTDCWQDVSIPIMFANSKSTTSQIVTNAIRYIHENYTQKITLKSVAEVIYSNPNYLSTVFSQEKGVTLTAYLRNYRLAVAQKMLTETHESVEKIALNVGFYDIQHFSKIFKKEFGISPLNFRKANQKNK